MISNVYGNDFSQKKGYLNDLQAQVFYKSVYILDD